jgi:hypothetical protein
MYSSRLNQVELWFGPNVLPSESLLKGYAETVLTTFIPTST